MNPMKREILELLHPDQTLTAAELFDRSACMEKRQQAYSFCHSLVSEGLIEIVSDDHPKRYRLTDAGKAALERSEEPTKPEAAATQPEPPSPWKHSRPSLGELIAHKLAAPAVADTDAEELDGILDTLSDLIRALKRHLPRDYAEDIEDLEKAGQILQQLRNQLDAQFMEEAA